MGNHAEELSPGGDLFGAPGECILIVDDDAQILEVESRILALSGYRVITASNGAEAVVQFIEHMHEIKAAIVDMVMPVLDGGLTIDSLRRISRDIPIIPTSGAVSDEELAHIAEKMGTRHLPKPFSADQLVAAVSAALSR